MSGRVLRNRSRLLAAPRSASGTARGYTSNRRCARAGSKVRAAISLAAAFDVQGCIGVVVVLEVLVTILAGTGIGLSLAAPPGPVNAIIASHTVTRSWRAGFLVGLGATTADTIFLVVAFLARTAVAGIEPYVPFIALLGAGVMVYFAWGSIRSWRRTEEILEPKPDEHAKSYVTGLSVNLTSPYPILWWLTVGLVLINQLGPAVLVGFFAG